jgi:DNA-binding MarR family transcriptional regulator
MTRRHTPSGAAATDLVLEIFRANGLLLAAGDRLAKPLGLTSARWQVLGAIVAEPATVSQVARTMGLTRQSVQRVADVLAREGLVAYENNPNHRRAALLRLTPEGEHAVDRITERQIAWANALSRGLDPSALADAAAVLRTLQDRLRESPARRAETDPGR